MADEEVTIAEVLSEAGYATAFYGKGHLGDIEESYLNNQGFDEALFTPYNQVLSLWNPMGEGARRGAHAAFQLRVRQDEGTSREADGKVSQQGPGQGARLHGDHQRTSRDQGSGKALQAVQSGLGQFPDSMDCAEGWHCCPSALLLGHRMNKKG